MMANTPRSTLFPYTTLFRSCWRRLTGSSPRRSVHQQSAPAMGAVSQPSDKSCLCSDRKSTRLNSSHLVISYAVFCLKKKTKFQECLRLVSTDVEDSMPGHRM